MPQNPDHHPDAQDAQNAQPPVDSTDLFSGWDPFAGAVPPAPEQERPLLINNRVNGPVPFGAPVPAQSPVNPTGQRAATVGNLAIDLSVNDIYGRWLTFHVNNPHVYRELRTQAMEAKGDSFISGISYFTEHARWKRRFSTEGEAYKMPNAFRSMYARMLMEQEPALDGFFNTAELRSAVWPEDQASRDRRAETLR